MASAVDPALQTLSQERNEREKQNQSGNRVYENFSVLCKAAKLWNEFYRDAKARLRAVGVQGFLRLAAAESLKVKNILTINNKNTLK